jgi:hypothetical protein
MMVGNLRTIDLARAGSISVQQVRNYETSGVITTLDELAAGRPEQAIAAVEKRHGELARTSWDCLVAMSAFQRYIGEYYAELCTAL